VRPDTPLATNESTSDEEFTDASEEASNGGSDGDVDDAADPDDATDPGDAANPVYTAEADSITNENDAGNGELQVL
jgi:hypothetical protein